MSLDFFVKSEKKLEKQQLGVSRVKELSEGNV
jgi:hypothetical protein